MKKSMRMVKVAAALAIVLLFLIIHLADPAFLPHLWGLLSRGDIQETAAYIASFGEWAVLFSFLLTLFVNALGFPPAIIFSTANTLIFGIFWGIFLSVAAETVGVLLSFVLLRFFFRDAAEKIINKHPTLSNLDKYSGKRGFARMVPYFPSILLNALGALSAMSMRDYVIASFVGKFPSTGIEAIIGHDTLTHQEDPTRLIVVCIFAVVLIAGAWIYEKRAAKHAPETPKSDVAEVDEAQPRLRHAPQLLQGLDRRHRDIHLIAWEVAREVQWQLCRDPCEPLRLRRHLRGAVVLPRYHERRDFHMDALFRRHRDGGFCCL